MPSPAPTCQRVFFALLLRHGPNHFNFLQFGLVRRSENDSVAMLFGDFPGSVRWWRLVLFDEVVKDD